MQQGGEAETVVALLLNAHPAGAKEKDNVRCRTMLALCTAASALRAVPASADACCCSHRLHIATAARAHALSGCLRRAQDKRLPLHIAALQQGSEAEKVVTLLLNAHPEGAKEKDNVRGCALMTSSLQFRLP